jgi:CRISPR-associated protein Csh1
MLKEVTTFVNNLDPDFKNLGIKPKDGLHVLLKIQKDGNRAFIDRTIEPLSCYTGKKNITDEEFRFLKYCNTLSQVAWMVDTNKCFDTDTKAIHSCSPYCLAIKKTNLIDGEKYKERSGKNKSLVYDNILSYFSKAKTMLENDENKGIVSVFAEAVDTKEKLHSWLNQIPDYDKVKDGEYIIFYLDYPIDEYQAANEKYLSDKLFNTPKFTISLDEEQWGTSNFFNGYPSKKPFLTHQSATFDISGRISANEALALFEFKDLLDRGILPKPLPIFIHKDEIVESIVLFKKGAEADVKLSYKEIIEALYKKYKDELGNYYLLFYQAGEVKDYDFVPVFKYDFSARIENHFMLKSGELIQPEIEIETVFDLEYYVFNKLIGNKYRKVDYFKDLDTEDYNDRAKVPNKVYTNTFYCYSKFRKAVYDFVYKSKRQGINENIFYEMVFLSLKDDLHYDNEYQIKEKLNIWFSLYEKFCSKKYNETMASKLKGYREFIENVTNEKVDEDSITDEQFMFAAGQVINYLLYKSRSSDQSYKLLEPYLQKTNCTELKKAIANDFSRYKHENFSSNFEKVASIVLSYETEKNIKTYLPELLSGVFSKNQLFFSRNK